MTNRMDSAAALTPRRRKSQLHWQLLLMVLPALIYLLIFHYKPMYGVVIAFKNYKFKLGILGSPWCGLENFQRLFSSYWFPIILKNTLTISILSLVMGFPMPILLALMVNEIEHEKIKRTFQTISYAPHFISTIVVCGMVILFTNPNSGIINKALGLFGLEPVAFMQSAPAFKWVYVLSGIWQSTGWSSIIYFAALSGVDKSLLEAAEIDALDILNARMLAMNRAIEGLARKADLYLIDGNRDHGTKVAIQVPHTLLVGGDGRSASIAAASILAKVSRDRYVAEVLDKEYPQYQFAKHKGYGTKLHYQMLDEFGPCPEHRRTFLKKWEARR